MRLTSGAHGTEVRRRRSPASEAPTAPALALNASAGGELAQSLSALYPNGTDEKRWVDGLLARKKDLGV